VQKLARELNLAWRAFDMDDWRRFRREISGVNLLVNAAGPLVPTSVLVAESCLAAHTHYFDLSNQIPSLVGIYTLDAEAKKRELTLLPGLALSPAASNCLIQHLHSLFPDADCLDIALEPFMKGHTPGANLTVAENIAQRAFRRRRGELERFWLDRTLIEVDLPMGARRVLPSALGDVEAAYRSTRVPNITTYIVSDIPVVPSRSRQIEVRSAGRPVEAESRPMGKGPGHEERSGRGNLYHENNSRRSLVWARMSKLGRSLQGWLQFGEGHDFTAAAVVAGVSRLVDKKQLSSGVHTPATALGADFILDLPNVTRTIHPLEESNED
jgi:short subunit dehydrogenase-like uncharacterized protein